MVAPSVVDPVDVFDVLAEPSRRRILDLLVSGERSVGEMVDRLPLSQPAVSKHLRVLREARLVEVRVEGQRRVYRVGTEPLRDLDAWLGPYRAMWSSRLDALGRHLDETALETADETADDHVTTEGEQREQQAQRDDVRASRKRNAGRRR